MSPRLYIGDLASPDAPLSEEEFIARCASTLASGAASGRWAEALRRRVEGWEKRTGERVLVFVGGEWKGWREVCGE